MNYLLLLTILLLTLDPVVLRSQDLKLSPPQFDTPRAVHQQSVRPILAELHFEVRRISLQSINGSETYFDQNSRTYSQRSKSYQTSIRYRVIWYLDGEKPKVLNRKNRKVVREFLQDRPESLAAFNRFVRFHSRSDLLMGGVFGGVGLAILGRRSSPSDLPFWQANGAIVVGGLIAVGGLVGGGRKWHRIRKRLEETARLYNQGR
ncbi:MAG: hypothetical protein AAF587_34105 [Bacteroidota bacterium]